MATVPTADLDDAIKNMEMSLSSGVSRALSSLSDSSSSEMKELSDKVSSYLKSLSASGDALKAGRPDEALEKLNNIYKNQKSLIDEISKSSELSKKEQTALKDAIKDTATGAKQMTDALDGTKKAMANLKDTMNSVNQIGGMLNKSMGDSFTAASALKGAMAAVSFATMDIKGGIMQTLEASQMMIEGISKIEKGFRDTSLNIVSAGVPDDIKTAFDEAQGFVANAVYTMTRDFNLGAEETEKMMSDLANVGFKNLSDKGAKATEDIYLMSKTLGMSAPQVTALAGTLHKEFGYTFNQSKNIIMEVAEASKNANVSQAEYSQTVIATADRLKEYNLSLKDVNSLVKQAAESGRGWGLAVKDATEMAGGLARQDLGKRAFMAQQMGGGKGDILGAAAMLKYEADSADTKKYMMTMLEKVGGSQAEITRLMSTGSKEDREKAFGMAQKTAMASGLDEGTVMRELLKITTKKDGAVEELQKVNDKLGRTKETLQDALTANDHMKKLGKMADLALVGAGIYISEKDRAIIEEGKKTEADRLKNLSSAKSVKAAEDKAVAEKKKAIENQNDMIAREYKEKKAREDSGTQSYDSPVPQEHHIGGPIRKFHDGGEVPAILQAGEFVINKTAVSSIGEDNLRNMNATGNVSSGGSTVNVNVDLNVMRLKELVNIWFSETFRSGMRAVL